MHRGASVVLVQGAHTGGSLMKELQAQHAGVSVVQVPPNMRIDLYRACVGESPVLLTQQDMLIAATDSRAIIIMHMDSRARLFNMSV